MRQALHIFKKDVVYLRREIVLMLSLAAALFWLGSRGVSGGDLSDALSVFLTIAAAFTIARLVHAEVIPGENQFWITRPYDWRSLLLAKLIFIGAFIALPVMTAQ